MKVRNLRGFLLLAGLLVLTTLACSLTDGTFSDEPPSNAAMVEVMANTSLAPWLQSAVAEFNASRTETSGGQPAFAVLNAVESGQAVTDLVDGTAVATLWIPDDDVWVDVLADQGSSDFRGDCVSVAESPLVIGMWRPMAEALGWPGLPLGWLDIGSLAADPNAWAYYSGGEYGDTLRLSHTHPGLSGSGANTLLAIVQAAQSKTDAVTAEDIQQPIVQASVGAFESAVAAFNSSTDAMAESMATRGPGYLGAAVMYESNIIEHGNAELVAIYPLEGTFMATHPACINQSASAEEREAAQLLRNYLLSEAVQQQALERGLRPVNPAVSLGPPLVASNGVDPTQPEIIFNGPSVESIYAVQELWQSARKPVNLVMLLDTSGSMRGDKIESMKAAAEQFVAQMGDEDAISLVEFYTNPVVLVQGAPIETSRQEVINAIRNMEPGGDTALFDAIAVGSEVIAATGSPQATNAMIVLSDGLDTSSMRTSLNDELIERATANATTIFTIAYGGDADEELLSELATRGYGTFYLGNEASIAAIYDEMSAAFGGAVGIGR